MMRTLALLSAPVLLAGCISLGGKPPETLIALSPDSSVEAGASRTAGVGDGITILVPTASQALMTTRVPVTTGTNVAYVKEAFWTDNPNRLFQRLLSETIAARTGKVVLDARQFTFDPGIRLAGQLQEFGIDASAMQAVVTYDATLMRDANKVETRRFEARTPVSAIEATTVGPALNSAANKVAADVAAWVG